MHALRPLLDPTSAPPYGNLQSRFSSILIFNPGWSLCTTMRYENSQKKNIGKRILKKVNRNLLTQIFLIFSQNSFWISLKFFYKLKISIYQIFKHFLHFYKVSNEFLQNSSEILLIFWKFYVIFTASFPGFFTIFVKDRQNFTISRLN